MEEISEEEAEEAEIGDGEDQAEYSVTRGLLVSVSLLFFRFFHFL